MSSSVNVTQLRQNLGEYLKQIRVGKEVEVTMHGKVIARLVPEAAKAFAQREKARRTSQDRQGRRLRNSTWRGTHNVPSHGTDSVPGGRKLVRNPSHGRLY